MRFSYKYKFWLEADGKPLLGRGRYELLKYIDATNSLKKSSLKVGITSRTAYNYIKRMEKYLGKPIIQTFKGGPVGGHTELADSGRMLIKKYEEFEKRLK